MPYIIAVDLGGTNCRFAGFTLENGVLALHRTERRATATLPDTDALLAACETLLERRPATADAFVLGMAGPVSGGLKARLTNAPLEVDLSRAQERYGLRACRLVNDFMAEACACLTRVGEEAPCVLPSSEASPTGPIGIIGAGTGLGTASLIRDSRNVWMPLPAEGGHVAFPFAGREEAAFEAFAAGSLGLTYLRGDDVLTGRGLCLLHRFLTGERREAHEIAAEALVSETETLRWYARFYGRACRNWALSTLCTGGLFVTGGIAMRNPLVVGCAAFRESFYDSPHNALLRRIPVRRYADLASGLWGSAWIGARMLEE